MVAVEYILRENGVELGRYKCRELVEVLGCNRSVPNLYAHRKMVYQGKYTFEVLPDQAHTAPDGGLTRGDWCIEWNKIRRKLLQSGK